MNFRTKLYLIIFKIIYYIYNIKNKYNKLLILLINNKNSNLNNK